MEFEFINFFNPDALVKNLKCTIHKSGKLGFTMDAANHLELKNYKCARIGQNKSAPTDDTLYVVFYPEKEPGAFSLVKAGEYYYLSTKVLFDNLKIEYTKSSVTYDITPEEQNGQKYYILKRKTKGNTQSEQSLFANSGVQ